MSFEKSMLFSSRTLMGRDQSGKIQQILQTLNNNYDSIPFRQPVNWQQFGLLDYPTIVKTPMDLSTVKKKMQTNRYQFVQDCMDDINTIWSNAKLYNPKQNQIHKLADKLEKQTKKMIKNYLPFIKVQVQGKKKIIQKKQIKPIKQTNKQIEPKSYMQKQQQIKNQNGQPAIQQPQHVTIRKKLFIMMQLCNKDQIGVIFQLLKKNKPDVIDYDENGTVNVRGEKLDDKMVKRLNQLMQLWGFSEKNTKIMENCNPKK